LLGVTPVAGRGFVEDDERTAAPVVLIGHDLWTARFGRDAGVAGRVVHVNGIALTVVGVAPPDFRGVSGTADLWVLHAMAPQVYMDGYLESDQRFLSIAARLGPGGTMEQAQAELEGAGARALAVARTADDDDATVGVLRPRLMRLDEAARDPARVVAQLALSAAALGVLLIATVNLSGLLLARAVARARETAVRAALGAGRARLLRQALVEGCVLGMLGGAMGLVLGLWSVDLLGMRTSGSVVWLPLLGEISTAVTPALDWRVVGFTLSIAIGAASIAALAAVLRAGRIDLTSDLASGARVSPARIGSLRRPTVLTAAAAVQVACSLMLLVGAALLVDGLRQLSSIDPGFDARDVLAFTISPPDTRYGGDAAAPLLTRLLERMQAVPGVQSATVSLCTPYRQCSRTPLYIDGSVADNGATVGRHYVASDHFRTLGIPLLRGRTLTPQDRAGAPRVAVINETAARRYWPDTDPIGQRVRFGSGGGFASPDSLTEIVGVVADVLYDTPGADIRPDFYTSYMQFTWASTTVMVRAAVDPATLVTPLRRAVADVDPDLPIHDVRAVEEWSAAVLADQRFTTLGLSAIATLGLLLACLGIYGIMAWSVAQRRRELGIRHALGATTGQVVRLILAQGAAIALIGIALGVIASLALARTMHALLPHAAPIDPLHIAFVAALQLAITTLACWLPARQAGRIDPVRTIGDV
jgi:putative ABC transport system permease protein